MVRILSVPAPVYCHPVCSAYCYRKPSYRLFFSQKNQQPLIIFCGLQSLFSFTLTAFPFMVILGVPRKYGHLRKYAVPVHATAHWQSPVSDLHIAPVCFYRVTVIYSTVRVIRFPLNRRLLATSDACTADRISEKLPTARLLICSSYRYSVSLFV